MADDIVPVLDAAGCLPCDIMPKEAWVKIPKVAMSFFGKGKFSYDGTTLSWGPNTLKLWLNNISKNITAGSIAITADYQFIYVTVDDWTTPGVLITLKKISYTNVNSLTEMDIIIGFITQQGQGNEGCFHMLYGLDHEHIHDGYDSHPIEGTVIKSTGEVEGTKVLTEDGVGGASWQDAPGGTDPDAIHDNVENEINTIVASLTPADADVMIAEDADAATPWSKAKLTMLNLYNYIKAKTDLVYASITHAATHSDGGNDEITVQNLGSGAAIVGQLPAADGTGGLSMAIRYAKSYITVFRTAGVIFPNNDNAFCHMGGAGAVTATEAFAQVRTTKMKVTAITGYCSGGSGTFTVRKNGADTLLTGTVNTVGQFIINTSDAEFAEGDFLSLAYDSGVNWAVYGIQLRIETEVI